MKKIISITLAFLFAKGLPKTKALALAFSLAFSLASFSQNIAITDDGGYTANPSAMLDVKSTTKGMLVPRLTTIQRDAISSPANGLLVFDTDMGDFYFYNSGQWINLTSATPGNLFGQSGNMIFLNDTTYNLGIGTHSPDGKLEVKADGAIGATEPIFGVINYNGDTVFAVYPEGVRINVADDATKAAGSKSGFAVGGFSLTKGATAEYLRVTPDSVRIYVEEGTGSKATASKGGFAIGGFSLTKGTMTNEYLRVTDDSVRVYIDKNGGNKATGNKGGFAIGGFSLTKSIPDDYFNISGADSAEIIFPGEKRMIWYPTKNAFLAGQVIIEDIDSVGTNSMAVGYESKSIGAYSQALGFHARAYGDNSTAIGNYANADSTNSFAFGDSAQAIGIGSYAFGSVGRLTDGTSTYIPTQANGEYSFALGMGAIADSAGSFAIGNKSLANGINSMALGYDSEASGIGSMSLGYESRAGGAFSVALGQNSIGWGDYSLALGSECQAGNYATALGYDTWADGDYSTTFGYMCVAFGAYSLSIGTNTNAGGDASFAMGSSTETSGICSFAGGIGSVAIGDYSFVFGEQLWVSGLNSFGIALNNQGSAVLADDHTMAIMGGEVGIGTLSPDYTLDVAGTSNLNKGIASGNALYVNDTSAIFYNGTYFGWGSNGSTNYFSDDIGVGIIVPTARVHIDGETGESPLKAQINGATKLVVDSNGGTAIGAAITPPANGLFVSQGIGINTTDFGGGTKVLALEVGVDPSASIANGVLLYADNPNAELKVRDELGNITTLSPHNFGLTNKSEPMAWSFYSENPDIGQIINVDMLRAIRLIENLTGEKLVVLSDLKNNLIDQHETNNKPLINIIDEQQNEIDYLKNKIDQLEKLVKAIDNKL